MKIKLSWIISAACLFSIAWMLVPRLTIWNSASAPGASEPARQNQATPQVTVEAMFQMMYPTAELDSSAPPVVDRFNQFHLEQAKDMTPEEQTFSHFFWDARRCGILYAFMTENLIESPRVTNQETSGDSATVTVSVEVSPPHQTEWTSAVFTFDLKRRGANWYVFELKVPKAPGGIYNYVKSHS